MNRHRWARARDVILIIATSGAVLYAQTPLLQLIAGASERVTAASVGMACASLAIAAVVSFMSPHRHLILGGAAGFVAIRWFVAGVAAHSLGALFMAAFWAASAAGLSRFGASRFSWDEDGVARRPGRTFAALRAAALIALLGELLILAVEAMLRRLGLVAGPFPAWIWAGPLTTLPIVVALGVFSEAPWQRRMLGAAFVAFVAWLALVAASS